MKVLGINGSPRMKTSSTFHIMEPFLVGMKSAGAETEVIHVRQLDLGSCLGCYTCWARTPGQCVQHDGMAAALEKFNTADIVVFGTPLYHFTLSGLLKTFIERTLPRLEPWLVPSQTHPGQTGHPLRGAISKPTAMFLISPCGFPEFKNFDLLLAYFKHLAEREDWQYLGDIVRPGGEPLSRRELQGLFTDYYTLVHQAGQQIIQNGAISTELQAELRKDLFPGGKEAFISMANAHWNAQMDRFKLPQDQRHTSTSQGTAQSNLPLIATLRAIETQRISGQAFIANQTMLDLLARSFDATAMPDLRATIQFTFSASSEAFDGGPTEWFLDIQPGQCTAYQGRTPLPTLSIAAPHDVWQAICTGELNQDEAFTESKFEASGAILLLHQFTRLFHYKDHVPASAPASAKFARPIQVTPIEHSDPRPERPDLASSLRIHDMIARMPDAFNPKASGALKADLQFEFVGAEPGRYFLSIADGDCRFFEGDSPAPTITITADSRVWQAISRGELDGQEAFMRSQYQVKGDFGLLMRLKTLFGNGASA